MRCWEACGTYHMHGLAGSLTLSECVTLYFPRRGCWYFLEEFNQAGILISRKTMLDMVLYFILQCFRSTVAGGQLDERFYYVAADFMGDTDNCSQRNRRVF